MGKRARRPLHNQEARAVRLLRPYIPLAVRLRVAARQLSGVGGWEGRVPGEGLASGLARAILALSAAMGRPGAKMELHHRPALTNRTWNKRRHDYIPPANDPEFLVYLPEDQHDIETRVRGVGAQRSDLSQRRYLKNVERNRSKKRTKPKFRFKRKWPSRPLRRRPDAPSFR
jgi:hypothetical protein